MSETGAELVLARPEEQQTENVPATATGTGVATVKPGGQGALVVAPRPIDKAAVLLTAIGPELASGVLEQLKDDDMERFANALASLGKISQEALDEIIVEFIQSLSIGPELTGGAQAARELLRGIVEESEIDRILAGHNPGMQRSVWARLGDAPPKALATFLSMNHPQTVAVVLSEIKYETAAAVLEELDGEFARSIVLRLSRIPSVDETVNACIEAAIERDFLSVLQNNLSKRRPADLIAGLMNNISSEARDGFLAFLEEKDAHLAQDVQRTMFTFEDILTRVAGRDVPGILREMEDEDVLTAFKFGMMQESETVEYMIVNLPRRLAERYREDLEAMDNVPAKEGETAQIEMTKVIQNLAKAGTIKLIEAAPA